MRIKTRNELLPLVLLVIVLVLVITFFPSNVLRIILGLPFVLFLPGYALMAALFPRKGGLGDIERVALSFGLSIAVVPLIGLIINYTPWGIRLESVLWSTVSFIFIMVAIAWFRRRRLLEKGCFGIELHLTLDSWGKSIVEKVLSVILVLAILSALVMIVYTVATPKIGQKFTEFYILEQQGNITSYPIQLKVGEEAKILVGIINNEYDTVSYHIEGRINSAKNSEVNEISIEHGMKWEGELTFTPEVIGAQQEVQFFLYKKGDTEACLEPLRLWVDVVE